MGRSSISGAGFNYDTGGLTFGMTETILDLTGSNAKYVQSLTFTGANDFSGYTTTSIMAISATAIPEPSVYSLLALAAVIVIFSQMRRKVLYLISQQLAK